MSESLIIEGKQYISSRRAAEIAGYSNDYVGQLCRAGKLVCRMIGRFWYVDEDSILRHKNEFVRANQTSFKREDFISENAVILGTEVKSNKFIELALSLCMIVLVVFAFTYAYGARQNIFLDIIQSKFSSTLNTADAGSVIQIVENVASSIWQSAYSGIVSLASDAVSLSGGKNISNDAQTPVVVSSSSEEPSPSSVIPAGEAGSVTAEQGGLVVVPSTGTSSNNAKLAATVANSFSDTVEIKPDSNGMTGVIKPEFRTVNGHDFLYVMVPVKAATSSTASPLPSSVSATAK
jgi:hypothetical protein